MPIIDNTYIVSLYTGGDIEKKVDDLTNLHVLSDERNICNAEFVKMITNGNIYEHIREPYDDKYDTEVVVSASAKDENNREYTPVTIKVYKKGETTPYIFNQSVYKIPKVNGTSSATSKDMKDLTKKIDDLTTLNEFADKRNICNEEFIKMMSNKNIYEHTKEPYDDKYETEVVVGTVAKDENNREYIPVTVKVYKKGEATSYDVTQNIYKTPKPSTSSATSKDVKDLTKKIDDLTTLNEFADKRNICNEEFIKMLSSGNIYEHNKESYDDKYDTEVIAGTSAIDENNREYTPVTIRVYKKGDTTSYEATQSIYKLLKQKNVIILTNYFYKMSDIYPTTYKTMMKNPDDFNIKKLTTMEQMFNGCNSLASLDVSKWDMSNILNTNKMFFDCTNLTTIVGVIDMKSCTNYNDMFTNCNKLTSVKLKNIPSGFNASMAGLKSGQYTII